VQDERIQELERLQERIDNARKLPLEEQRKWANLITEIEEKIAFLKFELKQTLHKKEKEIILKTGYMGTVKYEIDPEIDIDVEVERLKQLAYKDGILWERLDVIRQERRMILHGARHPPPESGMTSVEPGSEDDDGCAWARGGENR